MFVPTFNSERTLANCLRSIREAIPEAEVFIVDKNSKDRTSEITRQFNARYISSDSNLGEARTLMCKMAQGDWFLMIDSDVIVGKDWFKEMMRYKDSLSRVDGSVGAISSAVTDKHTVLDADLVKAHDIFFKWKAETSIVAKGPKKNPRRLLTCAILLSKEACKGFASSASCFEDYQLQKYIQDRGYSTYVVNATAWHDILVSKAKLKQRCRCQGAGMRQFGETRFLRLLAATLFVPLFKAPRGCKRFVFSMYWNYLIGWVKHKEYGEQSWA